MPLFVDLHMVLWAYHIWMRNNLNYLWKKSGLSAQELADKIGVSRTYIYSLTTGKRQLNTRLLDKLAGALGCKASDIISDSIIESNADGLYESGNMFHHEAIQQIKKADTGRDQLITKCAIVARDYLSNNYPEEDVSKAIEISLNMLKAAEAVGAKHITPELASWIYSNISNK